MPANFLGLKLLSDATSNKAVASWALQAVTTDTNPNGGIPLNIQGQINYATIPIKAFKYILDIQSVQKTYAFGSIKRLGLQLTHWRAYEDGDLHFFVPGRVFLSIPTTGELFVFGSRDCMVFGSAAFLITPAKVLETINKMLRVDLPPNTPLEVWLENDWSDTGELIANATARVSLYNF